eukprot:3933160-Rhodomonas_salina.1
MKGTAGAGDAVQRSTYFVHDSGLFIISHWRRDEEASVYAFLNFVGLDERLAQVDTVKFQVSCSCNGHDYSACYGVWHRAERVLVVHTLFHHVPEYDQSDFAIRDQACRRVALDVIMEATTEHPVRFEQVGAFP